MNINDISKFQVTESYNDEPILYCENCLSLNIKEIDGTNYCDCCGNTNIGVTHIANWEEMYQNKYGSKFLN